MIVGEVIGQHLIISQDIVVAGTIDYLEMEFNFKTREWDGLDKWAHFQLGETTHRIQLSGDKIGKDQHLNLAAGDWKVYLTGAMGGVEPVDPKTRATTNVDILHVKPSGFCNEPFPDVNITEAEQIAQTAGRAEQKADAANAKSDEAVRIANEAKNAVVDSLPLAERAEAAAKASEASAKKAGTSASAADVSAKDAAKSAAAAAGSENKVVEASNAAVEAAQNAKTSETNAKTSETNSKASEEIATQKAQEASTSAQNSASSETNASDSASAAAQSEQKASTSEQNAAKSAEAAKGSEDSVAQNAQAAQNAANAAKTSETNSKASETEATRQAGLSEQSADAASKSALEAKTTLENTASAIKMEKVGPVITADDISPLEHEVGCKVEPKNLLQVSYTDGKHFEKNGVTIDIQDDGTLLCNGVTTDTTLIYLDKYSPLSLLKSGKKYTISIGPNIANGQAKLQFNIYQIDGYVAVNTINNPTFVYEDTMSTAIVFVVLWSGQTYSNMVLKPMLVEGTEIPQYIPPVDLTTVHAKAFGKNLLQVQRFTNVQLAPDGDTVTQIQADQPSGGSAKFKVMAYKGGKVHKLIAEAIPLALGVIKVPILSDGTFDKIVYGLNGSKIDTLVGDAFNYPIGTIVTLSFEVINIDQGTISWRHNMLTTANDTEYVPYIEPQTLTPSADGTVTGMKSIYPYMTVLTDNPYVDLNVLYNVDTKLYLNNKINKQDAASTIEIDKFGNVITADDVSPVEHLVDCRVEPVNLLPFPYIESDKTLNGITFKVRNDGSVKIEGTATKRTTFTYSTIKNNDFLQSYMDRTGYDLLVSSDIPKNGMSITGAYKNKSEPIKYYSVTYLNPYRIPSGSEPIEIYIVVDSGTAVPPNTIVHTQINSNVRETPPYTSPVDISTINLERLGDNVWGGIRLAQDLVDKCKGALHADVDEKYVYLVDPSGVSPVVKMYELSPNKKYTMFVKTNKEATCLGWSKDGSHILRTLVPGKNISPEGAKYVLAVHETLPINIYYEETGLMIGDANELKPYDGTTYPVNPDGTVDNVKSISPSMTLIPSNPNVNIEATYNVDTKTYIDRKFTTIQDALIDLGGTLV